MGTIYSMKGWIDENDCDFSWGKVTGLGVSRFEIVIQVQGFRREIKNSEGIIGYGWVVGRQRKGRKPTRENIHCLEEILEPTFQP